MRSLLLKNILESKGYIRGPFGSALKRGEMRSEGIPVYEQSNAIKNDRVFRYFIDQNKYEELKRFKVQPGDLVISCSGTVGEVTLIKENDPIGIISQALLLLRSDKTKILPEFLMYFFKTAKGHNAILERSSGSVQVNIARRSIIENIEVPCPELSEQQKIIEILSAIDDKIELNNRINQNLENEAMSIFKQKIALLENLPLSWKLEPLDEVADFLNGLAMQKFEPVEDEESLPVLKIVELKQGFCDLNSNRCHKRIKPEYIVNDGDVIFSWSASLVVDVWCGGTTGLNQHLFKVTSKKYDKWFYYYWTKFYLGDFIHEASAKATTMGHITRDRLSKAICVIPDEHTYKMVGNLIEPILDTIIANRLENKKLIELRESVLPKLMSGEIRL